MSGSNAQFKRDRRLSQPGGGDVHRVISTTNWYPHSLAYSRLCCNDSPALSSFLAKPLTMDGVSSTASVIAVIDVSAKVVALCFQYSVAVKNASNDVQRLQEKVKDIRIILERLKLQLERSDGARLSATSQLTKSLEGCQKSLQGLKIQLEPGKTLKAMNRLGVRALKWPFKSKEIEKIVTDLEKHQQAFSLSLQIDQT